MKSQKQRKQRTVGKKRLSRRPTRRTHAAPRTAKRHFAKSERFQNIWNRALSVLGRMRRAGASLAAAAREEHTDPRTVRKYLGKQLRKPRPGKRYRPTKADRLTRGMRSPTGQGMEPLKVRGSRQASLLGKYLSAVGQAVRTGQTDALAKFEGKSIAGRVLITDVDTLTRLGQAGLLELDEIYAVPGQSS